MILGIPWQTPPLRTSIPWVGTEEGNYHVSSPLAHSTTTVIHEWTPQQASTSCQLPENLGEVVHVAVSPIPRVSGEIMGSGFFYKTGVPAEGICTTGTQGGEPVSHLPNFGAWQSFLWGHGGILICRHIPLCLSRWMPPFWQWRPFGFLLGGSDCRWLPICLGYPGRQSTPPWWWLPQ